MIQKKKFPGYTLFFIALMILAGIGAILCSNAYTQDLVAYSFISFDISYQNILERAKGDGYQVKEEEINSIYGKYSVYLEKSLNFYSENLFLFFDQNRALIFFTVRFKLHENQPKSILERLISSIATRLTQKYGETSLENFPYYRVTDENYEIMVKPIQAASPYADVTFKHLDRFSAFGAYYEQEIKKLENEAITRTVNNF